ncbi:hypothetical protein CR513_02442, partial [Mucuna pruriens]
MKLFGDKKRVIEIEHNHVQHERNKYIEINKHFIKQNLEEKIIKFHFVQFEDQFADMLTKTVSSKSYLFNTTLVKYVLTFAYSPSLQEMLERGLVLLQLKANLSKTQHFMKKFANKG